MPSEIYLRYGSKTKGKTKEKKVFPIFVINREKEKNIWQKIVLTQSCYRICPFSGRLPFTRKAHLIEIFPLVELKQLALQNPLSIDVFKIKSKRPFFSLMVYTICVQNKFTSLQ